MALHKIYFCTFICGENGTPRLMICSSEKKAKEIVILLMKNMKFVNTGDGEMFGPKSNKTPNEIAKEWELENKDICDLPIDDLLKRFTSLCDLEIRELKLNEWFCREAFTGNIKIMKNENNFYAYIVTNRSIFAMRDKKERYWKVGLIIDPDISKISCTKDDWDEVDEIK
jgi:hypothetical protein